LTMPKYSILSSGKLKVEGKDELRKRGVASPNRADAWLLTFADVGASAFQFGKSLSYPNLGTV
jgi:hypothetical protein